MSHDFIPGDVLLLEREIASLPYETGLFVLCELTSATAEVALVSADDQGLYAIDNRWTMSREDFTAFTSIGERARLQKQADERLKRPQLVTPLLRSAV